MKYTKYLSALVKENDGAQFNQVQMSTFMNVVALENQIEGINKIKRKLIGSPEEHRFDLVIFDIDKRLTELTANLEPKDFVKDRLY